MRLIAIAQALEDLNGVRDGGFANLDRLEPALQRRVLLDVLAVLIERGCADGLQLTASQLGLEDRRGVDRTLGGACPDEGVQLVDEQDDVAAGVDLLEDLLEALFEVTAISAAGHQRPEIEGVELLVLERLGNLAVDDRLGETLHHSGLTHAGFTDQHRIVLGASAQHLHDPLDFLFAADDRVQLAFHGSGSEIATELVEHQ